ncbi:hypothetical protein E4U17_004152 [Claviceps sp. LM77 group G4]|nr:hypothetical protein E4U17_004152 [Claviceps sp. LM77 group G4]KAG6075243.1 hypothetical protein E4U16_003508 [Claviceps sp. LM84 group G4]
MVGAGEESLLNAAQNGNLVAAICRIADSPPESISTTDGGSPSQLLTQTSPVSRSDDVSSATTTRQVSPSSEPGSQTLAASTSVPVFASSAATKTITSSTSIADDDGPTRSDTTATSRATSLPTRHQTTATSTLQAHSAITRSLSTSLTSSRAAAQIQPPRGGGGSPFDPLPESAAVRLSGGGRTACWLAVSGACVAGIYALLY